MGGSGQVRIAGGRLRGKLLKVIDAQGLRPTPDRVRESVFSWLEGRCEGARVLDLFAGSGALGIEASSRGASQVILVECNHEAASLLKEEARGLEGVEVVESDALSYLQGASGAFDLVFLDPPYSSGLLAKALRLLDSRGLVGPSTLLYVEMSSADSTSVPGYECLREQASGQVKYALWKKSSLLL
ncbi:MAG: 16S rRNA (guanine(966)-N(2))-methyltransferase RsmD [Succinivibrio sp.]